MSDPGLAAGSLWAAAGLCAAGHAVGVDGEQHGHAVPGAGGDLGGVAADVQP